MREGTRRSVALVLMAAMTATGWFAVPIARAAAPDPYLDSLWGLSQVRAADAWSETSGEGAVVAVLDSGIDLEHEDLAANVVPGIGFVGCESSGCGDGGWKSPASVPGGSPHGTHVAGTIAAVRDNGLGVAGVAPEATLVPVRVLDGDGSGSAASIISALHWATDLDVDVINMSLGYGPESLLLAATGQDDEVAAVREAVAEANRAGIVVVVAAGNDFKWICGDPASTEGALCVTATTRDEAPSGYSNTGVKEDQLSVAAPGGLDVGVVCDEQILSTVPEDSGEAQCDHSQNYGEMAGTSMAAPHVAGVAALLRSLGCSRDETLNAITATARRPGTDVRGVWDPQYGYGIVDAAEAVSSAGCTPAAPNAKPIAQNDAVRGSAGRDVNVRPLANDSDSDGDELAIISVGEPAYGTATIQGNKVVYRAGVEGAGQVDRFTYTISDGNGGLAYATVTVTIRGRASDGEIALQPVELHFQGNVDEGCSGDGRLDMLADGVNCPALSEKATLDAGDAARWAVRVPSTLAPSTAHQNVYTPNWMWTLAAPTEIRGPVHLEWWASCAGCVAGSTDWSVRIYADEGERFEARLTLASAGPGLVHYTATVTIPPIPATSTITLQLEPMYLDTQSDQVIFYDSSAPCPGAAEGPCDSTVTFHRKVA